ncbi:hypothetical protein GCM10010272_70780 [Streptomyces lateritius]|nr:hypothetical protein GCM10010272_70780 [Streptomyces lateritius]
MRLRERDGCGSVVSRYSVLLPCKSLAGPSSEARHIGRRGLLACDLAHEDLCRHRQQSWLAPRFHYVSRPAPAFQSRGVPRMNGPPSPVVLHLFILSVRRHRSQVVRRGPARAIAPPIMTAMNGGMDPPGDA